MRTKIGKRIGPVPITLAVFALAALLSIGLLLTINGGVTQAQGLPGNEVDSDSKKCEVLVAVQTGDDHDGDYVSDGGCFASGDSVDVVLKNTDDADKSVAVYVTGGDDFPGLQAMDVDTDDKVTNLGAEGVDEYLLTVDAEDEGFGTDQNVAGTETITVNRDMAKNGEVYLFVYLATGETKAFDDVGIPISVLAKDGDTLNAIQSAAIATAGDGTGELVTLVDAAVNEATQDPDSGGPLEALFEAADLPVVADDVSSPTTVAEAQGNLDKANAKIADIKDADDYDNEGRGDLHDEVRAAEVAIMRVQSAIDAIEGADPSYFLNDDANIAVKVNFREPAVEAKRSGGKYMDFDNGERGSEIYVGRESTNPLEADTDIRTGADEASITVSIRDRYGVALAGFVDFSIDTSASGAADIVFTDSNRSTHYIELEKSGANRGSVTVPIEGLPKTDAMRIPVTANFNNGELELMGNIVRKGDAMMVEASAYVCEADETDDMTTNNAGTDETGDDFDEVLDADLCDTEIKALKNTKTSDDPDEVVALGPEDAFFIRGKATDAVGNTVGAGAALTWKLTAGADNASDAEKAIPDEDGNTEETIVIASGSDAIPGAYSITVTSPDGEASTMIMVTVSDVASMIEVSCDPMMIPTDTGLTECTVMVTDANGNVPSNLHEGDEDDMVRVTVRSRDAQIIGVNTTSDADLDAMGMATFSVLLREDAVEGSSITVNVSSTIGDEMMRANTTVMYGEGMPDVVEPGPEMMEELMAPMNVREVLNTAGSLVVGWDAAAGAEGYVVIAINTSDFSAMSAIVPGGDSTSGGVSVMSGQMYNVFVASFNSDGNELSEPVMMTAN